MSNHLKKWNLMVSNDNFLAFLIVRIVFMYTFALDMTSLASH